MDTFKDYYRILAVDSTADDATIKAAFRRLARRHHPDVARTARAARRFHEIREAYEVLCDPERRARYDEVYRARRARRCVAGGRQRSTIRAPKRSGSAGVGVTLNVLGLRVGLTLGAGAARKDDTPRRRPNG